MKDDNGFEVVLLKSKNPVGGKMHPLQCVTKDSIPYVWPSKTAGGRTHNLTLVEAMAACDEYDKFLEDQAKLKKKRK